MAIRFFGFIVSLGWIVLSLYYRGALLDMAQRASITGRVELIFQYGTFFGISITMSFFLSIFTLKKMCSYIVHRNRNKE